MNLLAFKDRKKQLDSPSNSPQANGKSSFKLYNTQEIANNQELLGSMIGEGLDVDGIAHKFRLERLLDDAIFDFNEESYKKAKKSQGKRYWNEMDEFFEPQHPLKSKYRHLNNQATHLLIQQQQENSFYN